MAHADIIIAMLFVNAKQRPGEMVYKGRSWVSDTDGSNEGAFQLLLLPFDDIGVATGSMGFSEIPGGGLSSVAGATVDSPHKR